MVWKWFTGIALISIVLVSALFSRDMLAPKSEWGKVTRPYSFSIFRWEIENLFDKWEQRLKQVYHPAKIPEEEKVTCDRLS